MNSNLRIFFTLSICLVLSAKSFANERLVLEFDEFMEIVKTQHPITHQAQLIIKSAEAKKLKANGGFDPKLQSSFNEKKFKGYDYYSNFGAELKVPTWYGLSFKGGFQQNTGDYVNQQLSTPNSGLTYAGVNLTLGSGLLMDQRRADIKQAKIYLESSGFQQKLMINQLYFDASKAYWEWFSAFQQVKVMQDALVNSERRFLVIKKNALLGESSIMDTVEAKVQVNSRTIKLQEYKLKLIKSRNQLNLFLWSEGQVPLELENNVKPESIHHNRIHNLPEGIDSLLQNHPKLELIANYIEIQDLTIKLSKEQLKPKFDLKYNPLFENKDGGFSNFENSNYQFGFDFSYPILTRKARGDYRMQKIEKENLAINLTYETQKLKQSSLAAYKAWENYSDQQLMYVEMKTNYEKLAIGEAQLFKAGESSFFMVNSREKAFLSAMEGLISSIQSKNESLAYYKYTLCALD